MLPGLLQTLKQLPSSYRFLLLCLVFLEGILTTYINSNRPLRNIAVICSCAWPRDCCRTQQGAASTLIPNLANVYQEVALLGNPATSCWEYGVGFYQKPVWKTGDGGIRLRSLRRPGMTMNSLKPAIQKDKGKQFSKEGRPQGKTGLLSFIFLLQGLYNMHVDYRRPHLGEGWTLTDCAYFVEINV